MGQIPRIIDSTLRKTVENLKDQEYFLKTIDHADKKMCLIVGGDTVGTLYGAYRFAEHLGVRFYLEGDVVPDERMELQLPEISEEGKPLFNVRGIMPFHDFAEGPDLWNTEDYKAILAQVAKMRMNFIRICAF